MDISNATEFIDSYNKIDAQLREMYGFKPAQSFTDVVRRSAEKNTVVRRYENELADYARLRNAIVHQSTDGRIIAVPCDDVVENIRFIERLLCSPPTVGETLEDKRIVSIEAELSLRQAVMLMARTGYSNIPVYSGKRMIGIVNNRRVLRELGDISRRGAAPTRGSPKRPWRTFWRNPTSLSIINISGKKIRCRRSSTPSRKTASCSPCACPKTAGRASALSISSHPPTFRASTNCWKIISSEAILRLPPKIPGGAGEIALQTRRFLLQ